MQEPASEDTFHLAIGYISAPSHVCVLSFNLLNLKSLFSLSFVSACTPRMKGGGVRGLSAEDASCLTRPFEISAREWGELNLFAYAKVLPGGFIQISEYETNKEISRTHYKDLIPAIDSTRYFSLKLHSSEGL